MRNNQYPRIIQIMPADNIWIRYEDSERPGKCFYCKATCLALVEDLTEENTLETYIEYIDMDAHGVYELSTQRMLGQEMRIVYSDRDLSNKTDE